MTANDALLALRKVNFDWTAHIDEIWVNRNHDAEELQANVRAEISERLEDLTESRSLASPLGLPLVGPAGSGKTHLLGRLRQQAVNQGMYFILVDMTDVGDFWDTVALGYLRSLQQRVVGTKRQVDLWLSGMIEMFGKDVRRAKDIPSQRPPGLINTTNQLIDAVRKKHGAEVQEHVDVLRALILFSCDHSEANDLGYNWLQGLGINAEEQNLHAFRQAQQKPSRIVRGLSWLLSLQAPSVLALDQLDAIVAEHELSRAGVVGDEPSAQQVRSQAIIQGIAGGLLELRDVTRRTLTVVSSLEATWDILDKQAAVSMADRYTAKLLLRPGAGPHVMRTLVVGRLSETYLEFKVAPPYPAYPFGDGFFEKYRDNTPRELLKACDDHRKACRKAGAVSEIGGTVVVPIEPPAPSGKWRTVISELINKQAAAVQLDELLSDDSEKKQDQLIEAACEALILENPQPRTVISYVEKDFMGTGNYDPLHARIRLILTDQNERERHHSFRFVEKEHYSAFQARLKAALTASGIDHNLSFRGLTILRTRALPGGPTTQALVAELAKRGGRLVTPDEQELRTLAALASLLGSPEEPEHLEEWLKETRPVSQMAMFASAVASLYEGLQAEGDAPLSLVASAGPTESTSPAVSSPAPESRGEQPSRQATAVAELTGTTGLPIGHRVTSGDTREEVSIPLDRLPYHTCVFAGSGSGKTVFLKRVVEEAALLGIPSLVIDGANDLSRLGEAWPERPADFSDEDAKKAALYHRSTEVVVWTPGAPTGNPMRLNPLPDFAALSGATPAELEEERRAAVEIATSSLSDLIVTGTGSTAQKSVAILKDTLQHFARRGGSIRDLVAFLKEPPDEVTEHFEKGPKIAQELSEVLRAVIVNDPLIGGTGTPLDPALLFRAKNQQKTRVSVLSLVGLPGYDEKRRFMDQLASTLFSWIKKNPAQPGKLLGLLIIDEAKDFVPSGKKVPGKENIVRLAAQARKYGLGLLFATQEPKSIEHSIVSNCSTLLGGKMNSPAAIEALQGLLADKGGNVRDVAALKRGHFYFASGADKPRKIETSLCLSHHPSSPPTEEAVLRAARASLRDIS